MTSFSEAASLTLLEAMASSLPVVVTAVGGNPEIVEHETHGFLVPRGDHVAAANAVMTLLQHPDCARAMGAAGREHVRARFDLEMTVDNYLQRYRAAAARLREASRRATSEPRG
jgi:glycosyltransferase involved in cell wall biosynthesis